jgi:nitroreductase
MTIEGTRADVLADTAAISLDVEAAIFSTPATRRLKPDPIPEAVIWATIDAATRGPSSGNDRRWGWVVVRDDEIKRVIGGWYLEAWNGLRQGRGERWRSLAGRVIRRAGPDGGPPLDDPNYRSGVHLAHNIARAPVWIFAVLRRIPGEPSLVDGADIFGAVQNLMLAARKHGVGCTLTMLHRKRESDVSRVLGLPPDARPIALIPMGYPESGRFHTPRRPPVETVTHWERWGNQRERHQTPSLET